MFRQKNKITEDIEEEVKNLINQFPELRKRNEEKRQQALIVKIRAGDKFLKQHKEEINIKRAFQFIFNGKLAYCLHNEEGSKLKIKLIRKRYYNNKKQKDI